MPSKRNQIPAAVAATVNDLLSGSHRDLEHIFRLAGAPGEPPDLSHATKWKVWLLQTNDDPAADPHVVLGRVLEEFMEVDPKRPHGTSQQEHAANLAARRRDRERLRELLGRYGLSYRAGGKVLSGPVAAATRSLEVMLRERNLAALEIEFERALDNLEADPPAAVTSACAILEATFKVYIEDERLEIPPTPTIKPLWKVVQKHLALDPAQHQHEDLRSILSGLSAIVDGVGAFRTHGGSAHGRGRTAHRPAARHARLAVHSAHALVSFLLETWDARKRVG